MGTKEHDKEKVFNLGKELTENNQKIANYKSKMKDIKDLIKAIEERNEAIIDEVGVRTGDQETFDFEEE